MRAPSPRSQRRKGGFAKCRSPRSDNVHERVASWESVAVTVTVAVSVAVAVAVTVAVAVSVAVADAGVVTTAEMP